MSILQSLRQKRLLSINIAGYLFSPGLLSSLLTAFLLYVMISLAFWQLDRAEFKDILQQKIEQRKNLAVTTFDELAESTDDRRFYPVSFTGEYDTDQTFLLDNKTSIPFNVYHIAQRFPRTKQKPKYSEIKEHLSIINPILESYTTVSLII